MQLNFTQTQLALMIDDQNGILISLVSEKN